MGTSQIIIFQPVHTDDRMVEADWIEFIITDIWLLHFRVIVPHILSFFFIGGILLFILAEQLFIQGSE